MSCNLNKSLRKHQEKSKKSLIKPVLSKRIAAFRSGFEVEYDVIQDSIRKTDELSIHFRIESAKLDKSNDKKFIPPKKKKLSAEDCENIVLKQNQHYLEDKKGPTPIDMILTNPYLFKSYLCGKQRRHLRSILSLLIGYSSLALSGILEDIYDENGNLLEKYCDLESIEDAVRFGIFPTHQKIADTIGCDRATVKRWIRKILSMGLASVYRRWVTSNCYRLTPWLFADDAIQLLGDVIPNLYQFAQKTYEEKSAPLIKIIKSSLHSDLKINDKVEKFYKIRRKIEIEKHRRQIFMAFKRKFNYFPQSTASTEDVLSHYKYFKRVNTVKHGKSQKGRNSVPQIPSSMLLSNVVFKSKGAPKEVMSYQDVIDRNIEFCKKMGWASPN